MPVSTDWIPLPHGLEVEEHLFVIGDVHGNAHLLEEALDWSGRQPQLGEQELVFLGDIIDRGHENLRSIGLVMTGLPGMKTDILPGNHEIELLRFLDGDDQAYDAWLNIGGATMIQEIDGLEDARGFRRIRSMLVDAIPEGFLREIRSGPGHLVRGGFLLVHAGVDPHVEDPEAYLSMKFDEGDRKTHWAWIFDSFSEWADGWERFNAEAVVHGHQPVLVENWPQAFQASYGDLVSHRRLNLDFGSGVIDRLGGAEIHGNRLRFFGCGK